jgi:hypothetical protein
LQGISAVSFAAMEPRLLEENVRKVERIGALSYVYRPATLPSLSAGSLRQRAPPVLAPVLKSSAATL